MSVPVTKYFTSAMLVIFAFMTNVGLWSNHANWLTHDLEHSVNAPTMKVAADHIALHDINSKDVTSVTSELALEHELLHAVDHLQFFLSVSVITIFISLPRLVGNQLSSLHIPPSTYDTPFRPPRISLL